jgi:molecular chaperone DnaK (HSP70)
MPLLVDVTPLSLCVETVGGYRDVIIRRNSPVPCEQARTFVTARDEQAIVIVRVGQGESESFRHNTLLGQIELTGLPRAPRGAVRIVVTFALDTDGILSVSAREESSGRSAQARLRLVGMPQEQDVSQMAARQFARQVV